MLTVAQKLRQLLIELEDTAAWAASDEEAQAFGHAAAAIIKEQRGE
jgi:hypothetical protein